MLDQSDLRNVVFNTHHVYDDGTMTRIAHSCELILGDRTQEEFMQLFGNSFVQFFTHYGYDRMLRVCGRHFRDFLHGIDNLHETMRFSYPKMLSPSFYVTDEDDSGCMLHYRSLRVGFQGYVRGQLIEYARKFYDLDLKVSVQEVEDWETGVHVTYRLNFDNTIHRRAALQERSVKTSRYRHIPKEFFFKVRQRTFVGDVSSLFAKYCYFPSEIGLSFLSFLH